MEYKSLLFILPAVNKNVIVILDNKYFLTFPTILDFKVSL